MNAAGFCSKGAAPCSSIHHSTALVDGGERLKKAEGLGGADFWLDFPGSQIVKFYNLFRARRTGKQAQVLIRQFHEALGDFAMEKQQRSLERAGDTEFPIEPGVILADVLEDFLGDAWMQWRIDAGRYKVNIALVRVRGVLRVLRDQ